MRQVLVDPFWRMLLAVALIVGLVAPAVAVPMVLLNVQPVEAADCINITLPTYPDDTECVQPGDCVHVCWEFCCENECTPIDDFYVWIGNDTLTLAQAYYSVGDINCTGVETYNVCRCVYLPPTTPEGLYNVRVCSQCGTCACDNESFVVVVDETPPVVDVTSPAPGANWKCGDEHCINWTVSGEDCLNEVTIEYNNGSGWTLLYTDPSPSPTGGSYCFVLNSSLEDCDLQVRVNATDCCNLTGSDTNDGTATVDCTNPTVSNVQVSGEVPTTSCAQNASCLVGDTDVNISFDYSDNCGPLTALVEYKACGDGWVTIVSGLSLAGTSGTAQVPWHVPPTLDCCPEDGGIEFNVTVTDCPGNIGYNNTTTCVVAPLIMVGTVTGWCWHWANYCDRPMNCNDRTTIMVAFNKELDLSTVSTSDFKITNPAMAITGMEIHYGSDVYCDDDLWDGYTLVFLTVSTIMATNAMPTVSLIGCVEALDEGVEPLCGTVLDPISLVAADGIAPIISLSTSPASPGYNEMVTVTATSSEPLKEAYLIVLGGDPDEYCWDCCKPTGWPIDWESPCNVSPSEWENTRCCDDGPCANWTIMTIGGTGNKTATGTFRNTFGPNEKWFLDVSAHGYSTCGEYPWLHEKWTQESLLFQQFEYYRIELCEGWNLISVPRVLTNPAVGKALPGSAISKVYCYDTSSGLSGTWKSATYNPTTGLWTGTLTTIDPGKAYWVWCSPPYYTLRIYCVEPNPLATPPSIKLAQGWNMVGFYDFDPGGWNGGCEDMTDYFASILTSELAVVLWEYDACDQDWDGTTLCTDCCSGGSWFKCCDEEVCPGEGYWIAVPTARTLYPAEGSSWH